MIGQADKFDRDIDMDGENEVGMLGKRKSEMTALLE